MMLTDVYGCFFLGIPCVLFVLCLLFFFVKSGYGYCDGCDSAEFTECKGSIYNTNGGDSMSDAKMNIAWTGQLLAPLHYTHPKLNTIGTSAPYTEAMHMQTTVSLNSLY